MAADGHLGIARNPCVSWAFLLTKGYNLVQPYPIHTGIVIVKDIAHKVYPKRDLAAILNFENAKGMIFTPDRFAKYVI